VIVLKGGNIEGETQPFRRLIETWEISNFFSEEWFKEKHVIYLPA
jgi:16S rRNA (guanine527-N7)-methyltransferase